MLYTLLAIGLALTGLAARALWLSREMRWPRLGHDHASYWSSTSRSDDVQ